MATPSFSVAPTPALFDEFDAIIDARSPSEFALDHVPGAISCPVLSDEERAQVGTLYTQESPFAARRLGAALVARNIAHHLATQFSDKPRPWRPLVYCWRGGQRSGAFVHVLGQVGWDAHQLEGGYRAWRRMAVEELKRLSAAFSFVIVCGPTGSGKTALLRAVAEAGGQILDLERIACHKGSVLGDFEGPQPSQKAFETGLYSALRSLDPAQPVFVESESKRLGRLTIPEYLFERLCASPCVVLQVAAPARVRHLVADYAAAVSDPAGVKARLARLVALHGKSVIAQWHALIDEGAWELLASDLIERHYDPAYRRGGDGLYRRRAEAKEVLLPDLTGPHLDEAARTLVDAWAHAPLE